MTASELAEFLGAVNDFSANTIADRDALTDLGVGDRVFVADASDDATVDAGWAIYRVNATSPLAFDKIQEQESLDVTVQVDLGYTASATDGTITNSAGDNATIPAVDSTNAGLATPEMFDNSHVAATSGLTAATNPVNIDEATQVATFSIAQLAELP